MMQAPNKLKPPTPTLNMTPLIDIVFLLIVFFLVSSNLIRQEASLVIDLPEAGTGILREETARRRITINMPGEGVILIGSQPIDAGMLAERLAAEARDPRAAAGIEVVIRTHRDMPYRQVEPVLRDCALAGLWNIAFAVVDEPGLRRDGQ